MSHAAVDGRGPATGAVAAAAGAAVTWGARAALDRAVGSRPAWLRVNHRGEDISLLEGPAVLAGLLAGCTATLRGRAAAAAVVAVAGAGAFGLVDDLTEDVGRRRKGLRGHLGALRHGELTTGGLKVLGIGATSLAAAALAPRGSAPRALRGAEVLMDGALVAASANLLNLLDLRPGRALKAAVLASAAGTGGQGAPVVGAVLGSAAAAAPRDLGERDMLGDGGANALGAAIGLAAVLGAPTRVRAGLLAGVVALTVASEKVSFTEVIARTPVLRELDAWGRR